VAFSRRWKYHGPEMARIAPVLSAFDHLSRYCGGDRGAPEDIVSPGESHPNRSGLEAARMDLGLAGVHSRLRKGTNWGTKSGRRRSGGGKVRQLARPEIETPSIRLGNSMSADQGEQRRPGASKTGNQSE
jgi:hypothetical protein